METAQAIINDVFTFNAVIVLRLSNGPSEETLKKLLEYLPRRHPLLRAHIQKEKGRYFFVPGSTPGIPLHIIERQNNRHWQEVVEGELHRKFDLFTGPLVCFTLLKGDENTGENEIIITFQHSIIDAVSGASLIHEILTACGEIESRGFFSLPILPPAESLFPFSFKGIWRKWHMVLFMLRQMGDEFHFRLGSKGKRKPPIHPAGQNKILPMKLSKETTAALSKCSRKKRITLNNLLTASLLMAVHKHLYQGVEMPLRHINTADLRPYLNPSPDGHNLGSYFAMMRFTVKMKEKPQLWPLAKEIHDHTYFSLKKGDKFCASLLSLLMMRALFRFKSFRLSNTAMSFTGPLSIGKTYGKMEVQDIHAYVSNFVLGAEFTATGRIFDNHLYWDIQYLDSDMDAAQARLIADEIRAILESAAREGLE